MTLQGVDGDDRGPGQVAQRGQVARLDPGRIGIVRPVGKLGHRARGQIAVMIGVGGRVAAGHARAAVSRPPEFVRLPFGGDLPIGLAGQRQAGSDLTAAVQRDDKTRRAF